MLTPEQIDNYAGLAADPWGELQERIIRDMVRRILKAGRVTSTAEWQAERLEALGASADYVRKEAARVAAEIGPQEAAIFAEAMLQADAADRARAAEAGVTGTPLSDSPEARQIVNSGYRRTMNTLYNLTQSRALMDNQNMVITQQRQLAYYLDMAHMEAVSGAIGPQEAARKALNDLAKKGVGAITYPSGHVDSFDVVVLRALRTGISQTAGEISLHNAVEMGADLMEITAHTGARTGNGGTNLTNHAWWQGQIVSRSGRRGYLSLSDIGYGDVAGFKGANCRHDWSPFWEGASTPTYTAAQLREINNATVQYNGRAIPKYDATQMQRAQEREIRAQKRAFIIAKESGDRAAEKAAADKLAASRARLSDFCQQTGLPKQQIRETVPGFGRSEAATASRMARR